MGKEGEKLTGVASLDTLVPEEELKAPLSKNQVHKDDWCGRELCFPCSPGGLQGGSGEAKEPAKISDKTKHLQWRRLDRLFSLSVFSTFLLSCTVAFLLFPTGLGSPLPLRWKFGFEEKTYQRIVSFRVWRLSQHSCNSPWYPRMSRWPLNYKLC